MSEYKKEFIKTIESFRYKFHIYDIFRDFCEMSAISISNAVDFKEDREKRYLSIAEKYDKPVLNKICELLSFVVEGLEECYCDFLGSAFLELQLQNHWHGQFFTPYHVSKCIAEMNLQGAEEIISRKDYITICEPACGAGSMIIACADALYNKGINFQKHMHVTAIDVCSTAAHMAYIQFSLLHIPAIVYIGNSLSMEMQDRLYTPAYIWGLWDFKLRNRIADSAEVVSQKRTTKRQLEIFNI